MNPDPVQRLGQHHPLRTFLLTFGLIVGLAIWLQLKVLPAVRGLEHAVQQQNQRLDRIEDSLALLHYSNLPNKSSERAILDYLRYWSDQLARYGYNRAMEPGIQAKLDLATKALKAIGKRAYPEVEKAFVAALDLGEDQEEYRELLLDVAAALDKKEAADLAYEVLANPGMRSDLRNHAARTLLHLDSMRAGLLLKDIVLNESHKGMIKPQPPYLNADPKKLPPGIVARPFPGFFNNIEYLLQSSYPGKEDVLLTVLQQPGHNVSTYSTVIEGLRGLKSKRGARLFQRYFESGGPEISVPLTRSKMAYAIIEILGKEACPWLRKAYTREKNARVRANLQSLLRDYCR